MAVHKKFNNGIRNNALGRGLDALISTEGVRTQGGGTINEIPLDQIEANPNQPRREFDEEALRELADSVHRHHPAYHPATDFGKPIPDYCGRKTMESFTTSWTRWQYLPTSAPSAMKT